MKKKGREQDESTEAIQNEMEEKELRKSPKYEGRYKHGGARRTMKKGKGDRV